MAITQCSECGGQVSNRLNSCPHCGSPVEPHQSQITCLDCGEDFEASLTACPGCGGPVVAHSSPQRKRDAQGEADERKPADEDRAWMEEAQRQKDAEREADERKAAESRKKTMLTAAAALVAASGVLDALFYSFRFWSVAEMVAAVIILRRAALKEESRRLLVGLYFAVLVVGGVLPRPIAFLPFLAASVLVLVVIAGPMLPTRRLNRRNVTQGSSQSSGSGAFGILLIFAGIVVAGYFVLGYDTTSAMTMPLTGEIARVSNIGLMGNRLIGVIIAAAVFVVGAIVALRSKSTK